MNETFAGVYMDELGGGAFLVGAIFAVTALAELPTMHYADALVARFSGPRALAAAYALMGLSFFGYAFIRTPAWLLSLSVLKGLGFGLFFVGDGAHRRRAHAAGVVGDGAERGVRRGDAGAGAAVGLGAGWILVRPVAAGSLFKLHSTRLCRGGHFAGGAGGFCAAGRLNSTATTGSEKGYLGEGSAEVYASELQMFAC